MLPSLVFGAEKKISSYGIAASFGIFKDGLVLLLARNVVAAIVAAVFYGVLASAFVDFLKRHDCRGAAGEPRGARLVNQRRRDDDRR